MPSYTAPMPSSLVAQLNKTLRARIPRAYRPRDRLYIERKGLQLDFQAPDDDVYYDQVSRDAIGILLKTIIPTCFGVKPHPTRMGPLGRVHLHLGPRPALQRVHAARRVVREGVVVHGPGSMGFEVTDADGYVLAFV